jgi:short-subunit dehydrogenase
MDLHGKNIVLTGANTGIGAAFLKEVLKRNVKIVVADIDTSSIPSNTPGLFVFQGDLAREDEVNRLFEFAVEKMGGIDIFVANAGYAYFEKISSPSWQHIQNIFNLNVFSAVYSLEKMVQHAQGREFFFMVTASAMAKLPMPGYAIYSSTKAAIHAFAESYRWEMNDNAVLSVVYPIATKTNFFNRAGQQIPQAQPQQSPEQVALAMIKGIEKGSRHVYPSKLFSFTQFMNRFIPMYKSYLKAEFKRFDEWCKEQQSEASSKSNKIHKIG